MKKKEMKEVADNFTEVTERRKTLRKKVKGGNKAIEAARNKEEVNKGKNEKKESSKDGRRGGSKQEAKKQFKQPTGFYQTGSLASTYCSSIKIGRQT